MISNAGRTATLGTLSKETEMSDFLLSVLLFVGFLAIGICVQALALGDEESASTAQQAAPPSATFHTEPVAPLPPPLLVQLSSDCWEPQARTCVGWLSCPADLPMVATHFRIQLDQLTAVNPTIPVTESLPPGTAITVPIRLVPLAPPLRKP
jgi:hypothetical protein